MASTAGWTSIVTKEIKKSPLASNFFCGLILFGVEKIVEIEFFCPCDEWNSMIVGLLFFVPAFIVFLLMWNIYICKGEELSLKCFLHSFVPAALWVLILFFDGRYYACAKTSWSGKYEHLENSASQRWCNPFNSTQYEMTETKKWYIISQLIGLWTAFGLAVCYLVGLFIFCCKREETSEDKKKDEVQAPASVHIKLVSKKNTSSKFDVSGSVDVVSE